MYNPSSKQNLKEGTTFTGPAFSETHSIHVILTVTLVEINVWEDKIIEEGNMEGFKILIWQ